MSMKYLAPILSAIGAAAIAWACAVIADHAYVESWVSIAKHEIHERQEWEAMAIMALELSEDCHGRKPKQDKPLDKIDI